MKEWLASGKSLDDAIRVLSETLAKDAEKKAGQKKRDPLSIKNIDQLVEACRKDFNLDEAAMCRELNVSSRDDITDLPSDCYQRIAAVRNK